MKWKVFTIYNKKKKTNKITTTTTTSNKPVAASQLASYFFIHDIKEKALFFSEVFMCNQKLTSINILKYRKK